MSRTTREYLQEALMHFELARSHAAAGTVDQLVVDAVSMRLSAGIEVLARLDPELRAGLFGSDWALMWGCAIGLPMAICSSVEVSAA
ncbi:hypothetical protein G9U51_06660 [Calidifontibacter sp. DB0510]|uniref:Uncharacterized protein n=1 Tax=Metallococcus carri TaxID=1656884 RepID=A0A967AZX6_9MICO|nr:hypothetical protein [Metallococcus carri]NHN55464.1 hypothetical protein [Metallococcus carri]NOP38352.1 hypothetical protein [Calidifontibacter sp. DB2511S]